MKKSKFLLMAAALGGVIGIFSCTDYEVDDVNDLQAQIDGLGTDVNNLEAAIKRDSLALVTAKQNIQTQLNGKADTTTTNSLAATDERLQDLLDQVEDVLGITYGDSASLAEKTNLISSLQNCLLSVEAFDSLYNTKFLGDIDSLLLWTDNVNATIKTAKYAKELALKDSADIAAIKDHLKLHCDSLEAIFNRTNAQSDSLKALFNRTDAQGDSLKTIFNRTDAQADSIKNLYDSISALRDSIDSKYSALLDTINIKIDEVLEQSRAYTDTLDSIVRKDLNDRIDTTVTYIKNLYESADSALGYRIDTLSNRVDSIANALNDSIDTLKTRISGLETRVSALETKMDSLIGVVDSLAGVVDTLGLRMDSVYDHLKKQVTGILVQAVENPIYGKLSTPFGLRSNVLMAAYGEPLLNDLTFPASNNMNYVDASQFIYLPAPKSGSVYTEYGGTELKSAVGKLYLTINPNTVDFTGVKLALVDSQDNPAAGFDSLSIQKSDKLLTFGAGTRAASNGFYEATVTLSDAPAAEPSINKTAIKNAAKELAANLNRYSVKDMATTILSNINNNLTAYAVKCSWEDNCKEHSVYSYYDIAAFSYKPLSYEFMKGASISRRLPMLPNIENWLKGQGVEISKFTYDAIDPSQVSLVTFKVPNPGSANITITDNGSTADASATLDLVNETVTVTIDNVTLNATATVVCPDSLVFSVSGEDMAGFITMINNRIGGLIDKANDIVDTYSDVLGIAQEKIVDRVNSFITSINNIIPEDLNTLLQPTILFSNALGVHSQLNAVKGLGSTMKLGNTATLFLTSYTGELLAPAYKKYIAVTNVDGASAAAMNAANSQNLFCEVLDGNQNIVKFTPTEKGEYEIAYSCVDYFGKIVTRKFYINVQ